MTARVVIAGCQSGVGKTTVATGLMAALSERGLRVAPFKVGPDFIDPSYHAVATGNPGRNLDSFMVGPERIAPLFAHGAHGADVAVIEGVMGLYDGRFGAGEMASTAQVAKLLDAPVVLVVDASSQARSIAALVHGFVSFDPDVRIAGVVLNRVGSPTHEQILRASLEDIGVDVLGVIERGLRNGAPGRHLGLIPTGEGIRQGRRRVRRMLEQVRDCDIAGLLEVARSAPELQVDAWVPRTDSRGEDCVTVAIAGGKAFTFLYEENLELLRAAGARIVRFDPMRDAELPAQTDLVFIPGGFPETYVEKLAANEQMLVAIGRFHEAGGPVVAECGGLMYAAQTLDGKRMLGLIDADAEMTKRLTLGYREAVAATDSVLMTAGQQVRGHEFHYSAVEPRHGARPAWNLSAGPEGFVEHGLHASYVHTHWAATPSIADRLVEAARTGVAA